MHDLYVFIQSLYNRIPILLFVTDFTFAVLLLSLKWFPRVHDSLKLKVKVKLYSVCQNNPPPWGFLAFSPNGWEFFDQILHACYTFLSTLDYKFLFNYLQLWQSYAILSVTTPTQLTSCVQNVHHWPKRTLTFSEIFPKQLGIFSQNFTCLLYVPVYTRIQFFV